MSVWSALQRAWLLRFGQPAQERILYRAVTEQPVTRLLEIGLGDGARARKLIELLQQSQPAARLWFYCVDQFEARAGFGQQPGLSFKEAYRSFRESGVTTRLLPGDPASALAAAANSIGGIELVIVAADQLGESLERAWFYLPRMLATNARVYLAEERSGKAGYRLVPAEEVSARARAAKAPHARELNAPQLRRKAA